MDTNQDVYKYDDDLYSNISSNTHAKCQTSYFWSLDQDTVDAPISALPNSAQAPISAPFLGYQLFLCSKSPQ